MSADQSSSDRKESRAREARPIPMKPSRNQKQRSKLKQSHDFTAPPEAPEAPPPPPPPPPAREAEPLIRRMRLKRSGQIRDDLIAPPEPEAKREDEY